jgi:hypothetical protein
MPHTHRGSTLSHHTLPDRPACVKPEPHPIHGIANASATEETSLVFCHIGVGNTAKAQTVWLDQARR